jgi:NAD(P)-dependent dehydrogenase (short-subunit alcohol dehydrogenase family)
MTAVTMPQAPPAPAPDLAGRTVVVLGGSSGIGLETARLAREHGADVVLTARNPGRLRAAAEAIEARRTEAFDLTDPGRIEEFFDNLTGPIDHVLLSGGGPYYSALADLDFDRARRDLNDHILVTLAVARYAAARMRRSGSLLFIGGTGSRRPGAGLTLPSAVIAALPPLVANLALELAPIRVNLIAPGFVDTPLSAAILGEDLEPRRAELIARLPIGRLVGPRDVASLAVHLMTNTAITGATYDIDGGQQLLGAGG